jgi:cytochrome c oxidase cbb3-type subunit 1
MNPTENKTVCAAGEIDASCRVPLLVLFNGAALWLVLGLALGIAAMLSFHKPDMFADCPFLNYGHAQAAANNLLLYGFVVPAALGVMLWILARLSQAPLALPIVSVAAAHIWHLGILVGTIGILTGHSTGYAWLEYPRPAAVLLFAAFMLIALTAAATFGFRLKEELFPAHWFLFAALLVFPWIYSTANLFLNSNHPPRGVVQSIIAWWFANNFLFVWLALAGVGIGLYLLSKISGKPLKGYGYALFGFLTLVCFGSWSGIPVSAPVPAWLPTVSSFASVLSLMTILALLIVTVKNSFGTGVKSFGGIFCFVRFGLMSFIVSALLYICQFCPQYSRVLEFTWFGFGVSQWQILGFAAMILFGAIYEILPRMMGKELPFKILARAHFWLFLIGVLLFVIPLILGGVEQGKQADFNAASAVALKYLRISTTGQLFMLVGALCLLLNLFVMTLKWKLGLLKSLIAAVIAPLPDREVKA